MKKIMYLLLCLVISLSVVGCGSASKTNTDTKQPESTATKDTKPTAGKTKYTVGDTFNLDDLQYKVNSVRTLEGEVNQFIKPKDGNIFLLIDMTIENQGSKDAIISSMMSFKLVDKDGRSQDFSISALTEAKGTLDATLIPGRKVTGELGYEVLKGTQMFELEIISSPINPKIAVVEIPVK